MAATVFPPGPRGNFLVGCVADMRRDFLGFLMSCARDYGDFVPFRFGWKQLVFVNHPADIEYALVTNHRNFIKSLGERAMSSLVGNGLALSEGDFWLRQRRMMQPAFHRERINAYGQVMVEYTERLLADWHDGETREIHQDMTGLTMEIVAKTLFDVDVRGDAAEVADTVTVAMQCMTARLNSLLLLLPDRVPTPSNLRMHRAVRRLDGILYRMIDERRASAEDRGDLLSMLLQAQDADDGSRMTDRQVRDEAMTIFLSGHETTAVLLTWAWYVLSQHPEVEAKLVAELAAVLAGRAPTVADLPRLPYTEMVVTETLRLYPPAPAVGREALADCEIGGYLVPGGTDVLFSQWVMHRDSRFFEQPEVFNPDRWGDGLAKRLPRFAYFPFGGGPRQCIGNSFATMEAVLVLATMAQKFRLSLVPGHPVRPVMAPTLRPENGLKMVVRRR